MIKEKIKSSMRMKKLKFRVWNGEEMIVPDYITREGVAFWKENSIPTSSSKIMQYVGMQDVNGKDVYEHDLVESSFRNKVEFKGVVVYVEEQCRFILVDTLEKMTWVCPIDTLNCNFEVVGNLYENGETK